MNVVWTHKIAGDVVLAACTPKAHGFNSSRRYSDSRHLQADFVIRQTSIREDLTTTLESSIVRNGSIDMGSNSCVTTVRGCMIRRCEGGGENEGEKSESQERGKHVCLSVPDKMR